MDNLSLVKTAVCAPFCTPPLSLSVPAATISAVSAFACGIGRASIAKFSSPCTTCVWAETDCWLQNQRQPKQDCVPHLHVSRYIASGCTLNAVPLLIAGVCLLVTV